MKIRHSVVLAAASLLFLNASCSSSDSAPEGPAGNAVPGASDSHCQGLTPVVVDPAACTTPEAAGGATGDADADPSSEGGAPDCSQTHDADYGDTLSNSEGDDDDCKYHVSWVSTPIRENENVTFTVTTSDLTTHQGLEPLADGKLPLSRVEIYQPCQPNRRGPAQNAQAQFSEPTPGVYTGGPFRFDQPGRWVVRFHFYEQCLDGDTSPHGHIAFFVDVP